MDGEDARIDTPPHVRPALPPGVFTRDVGVAVLASMVVVAATRWLTSSHFLWAWDSVNFALALTDIDVASHQPHPPGYLGFVLLARAMWWSGDENAALLRVVLAASVATAALTWWLARNITNSRESAWLAWAIVVFSPLHWFYGSVAEVYAAEAAAVAGVAGAAWAARQRARGASWMLALAIAAAVLIKVSAAVLMAPLLCMAVLATKGRTRLLAAVALVVGAAVALFLVGTVEPLHTLLSSSSSQVGDVAGTSFLNSLNHKALNRSLRDMLYAGIAAAGVAVVTVLCVCGPRRPEGAGFLATWCAPFLLTCAFVHFPKPGYLLPILPAVAIAVASCAKDVSRRRLHVVMGIIAVGGTLQFAAAHPFPRAATGGDLRYSSKSWPERLRTELNSVLRPSWSAVRAGDSRLATFRTELARDCGGARQPVVLIHSGGVLTWRHAMFYMPTAVVVQVPSQRSGLLVSRARNSGSATEDSYAGDCLVEIRHQSDPTLVTRQARVVDLASHLDTQRAAFRRGPVEVVTSEQKIQLR